MGIIITACSSSGVVEVSPTLDEDPLSLPSSPPPTFTGQVIPPTTVIENTATPDPFLPLSFSAPDCSYGGAFKSISAVDRITVRVEFCQPQPAFREKIAFPTMGIYSSQWLEETAGASNLVSLLSAPVGSGPYRLSQWLPGEKVVLEAFDSYWGDAPQLRTINILWSLDAVQRLLELQVGMVDGIDNPPVEDFETIQADVNLQLLPRRPLSVLYVGINRDTPPLNDARVRKAIALGLDRQKLLADYFPPGYQMATHFTPCVVPFGCEGDSWYAYDPQEGRALLEEAGFGDGFEVLLSYRNLSLGYLPDPLRLARGIKMQLEQNLGLRVILNEVDADVFLGEVDRGEVKGLYLLGWGADYPHVTNFLDMHFGSGASQQFGSKYEDLVNLLEIARQTADENLLQQYYQQANLIIRSEVPAIPLVHGPWISHFSLAAAYRGDVSAAHASPLSLENFSILSISGRDSFTWMQTTEPSSLFCADETDVDSLRVCAQIVETLYAFEPGGVNVQPALAQECLPEDDLSVWVCTLRGDVVFHDGTTLDANDVVLSWLLQWDAAHPWHTGRTGNFSYFQALWGNFLNANQ